MSAGIGKMKSSSSDMRREWIVAQVVAHGNVSIEEIAGHHGVSRMTIHRDLDQLHEQGALRKVRGGASAQPSSVFESDVRFRRERQLGAKTQMCSLALDEVVRGDSIMIDDATSVLPLIQMIHKKDDLTILTNFRLLFEEIISLKVARLIGIGGEYHGRYASFTGPASVDQVRSYSADLYITSSTAISGGHSFHPDVEILAVKKAMFNSSKRRVLLADHTKFGANALNHFADLSSFDLVVVDGEVDGEIVESLRSRGVRIEIAPTVNK